MTSSDMPMTGERFVPQLDGTIRLEHLHRYFLACELADGKHVLDIACGEGYGSAIIGKRAQSVVGVDIAADAIAHAKEKYAAHNISFLQGSATKVPLEDDSVDLVVSFETIEHLAEQDAMLAELRRVLRNDGVLLISSPNKKIYSDEDGYQNSFHVKELYTEEFIELIGRTFPNVRHFGQKLVAGSVIASKGLATPLNVFTESGCDDTLEKRRYDLIVAAANELPPLSNSIFETPESPLDPYKAEAFIQTHQRELDKVLAGNAHLRTEYDKTMQQLNLLRTEYGKLLKTDDLRLVEAVSKVEAERTAEAERLVEAIAAEQNKALGATEKARAAEEKARVSEEKARAAEEAANLITRDANEILQSKHWKRTKLRRNLSNSMRKLRGKPKKKWPKSFSPEPYLASTAKPLSASARPLPAPTKKLELADVIPARPASVKRLDLIPFNGRSLQPHLTCVSMVRNEERRADDMMRHLCALFDRVVVIDHLSTDETARIVARYNGHEGTEVVLLKGRDEGYYQSEYMTAAARALIAEARSDWVFFLDFDEILPFRSRDIFLQALVPLTGSDVIHSHWCNLAIGEEPAETMQGAKVTIGPNVSQFTKVALNVPRLKDRMVTVAQGNHATFVDGNKTPYLGARAFGLFHLPVYDRDAFRAKLEQGARAYEKTKGHGAAEGSHWRDLNAEADRLSQDPILLQEVALRYGDPLRDILADVEAGKLTKDTRTLSLGFAQTEAATEDAAPPASPQEFNLSTIDSAMALAFPRLDTTPTDPHEALSKALYERLPPKTERLDPDPVARAARIHNAMMAAATEIEVLALPTAWSGHKAFLFTVMEAMRPRRYVELGTHAGASFFAACQHYKMNHAYGEAVAVDIWEGDHQAGFYDERVFNNFKYLLDKHFPQNGSYVRGYFNQAVNLFEPGAIDLLHIDGLHTYDAVKEDYETWRPALSANGTIIFHDTSEYQTDFAVWQLFEEIESDATTSFRFRHCHGLGVLAFGDRDLNPAIELLEDMNKNPARTESYFATVGSALFEQALRREL